MKTPNLSLDLFTPHQTNKEILLNEALLKLDQFITNSVQGFIGADDLLALEIEGNVRYIMVDGDHQNHIALYVNAISNWQFIKPQNGMALFVTNENRWFYYTDSWQPVIDTSVISFEASNGDVLVSPDISTKYCYLTDDANISFAPGHTKPFTLVLKQNDTSLFDVNWNGNILWNVAPPHLTQTFNRIDVFRFTPLPETNHMLAEIIGQNYQY